MRRTGLMLLVAIFGVLGWSVPDAVAEPSVAQQRLFPTKATEVFLFNRTGCYLTSRNIRMKHGTVTRQSGAESVPPAGGESAWATGPNRLGQIDGSATFQTADCADADDAGRTIRVTWVNPLAGGNSYGSSGTDGRFTVGYTGGRGVSATVYFTVRPAS